MAAEHWDLKDTLRVMTEKFNLAVDELNRLDSSSAEVNSATSQRLTELQNSFNTTITQIQQELNQKISSVSAEDIGLDQVDNTRDIDKPVSTLQQQAIDEATADFASTSEVADNELNTENLYDPQVSAPVKQYIEQRLAELLGTTINYEVASDSQLGIVKSGGDVQVNSRTGKMYVGALTNISSTISTLQSSLTRTIESLESNNTATSELARNQGTLTDLETANKDNLVLAINSINAVVDEVAERVNVLERKLAD